jgi:hypothetical protein
LKRLLALVILLGICGPTVAQQRTLPADAMRGKIRHVQEMEVEIDGRAQRLAPGAQVRDASNLIIMPSAMPAGAQAKYTLDADRRVRRVWILTADEARTR